MILQTDLPLVVPTQVFAKAMPKRNVAQGHSGCGQVPMDLHLNLGSGSLLICLGMTRS